VWQNARPILRVMREDGRLQVVDTRRVARLREWIADDLQTEIYSLCDCAQTSVSIHKQMAARRGAEVSTRKIDEAIRALCEAKILLPLQGKLLALAIG
jgi:hypothetical protein